MVFKKTVISPISPLFIDVFEGNLLKKTALMYFEGPSLVAKLYFDYRYAFTVFERRKHKSSIRRLSRHLVNLKPEPDQKSLGRLKTLLRMSIHLLIFADPVAWHLPNSCSFRISAIVFVLLSLRSHEGATHSTIPITFCGFAVVSKFLV